MEKKEAVPPREEEMALVMAGRRMVNAARDNMLLLFDCYCDKYVCSG